MTGAPVATRGAGGRIQSLDWLRGVAALLVMLLHLDQQLGGTVVVPGGYLAVDFFFLLSGFVLAGAYGRRLASGLTPRAFLVLRLVRLYPLYLLGLLLGIAALAWRPAASFAGGLDGVRLVASVGLNAALLPTPVAHLLFPFNIPAWTLFFEIAVNLLWASVLHRQRSSRLWLVIGASAAAVVAGGWWLGGVSGGFNRSTAMVGAARCLFSFTAGTVLFRSGLAARPWGSSIPLIPLTATLIAPMVLPVADGSPWRLPIDIFAVLLLFPAVLLVAARTQPSPALARVSAVAGDMSYPLYAIHSPLLALLLGGGQLPGLAGQMPRIVAVLVTLAGAAAALRWYDAPVRAWVSRRLRARESARPRARA